MTSQERKHRTSTYVLSWAAVVAMAALIFWMSANTGQQINHGLGIISAIKGALASAGTALFGHEVDVSPVGHFTEYLVFGALLFNALRLHLGANRALTVALATVIASLYGVSDELHQIFVPERSCDPADWAVDTIAAFVGAMIVFAATNARSKAGRE